MSALANRNSRGMLVPIDGADEGDRIPLPLGITNIGSGPAMDVVADSPGISYSTRLSEATATGTGCRTSRAARVHG